MKSVIIFGAALSLPVVVPFLIMQLNGQHRLALHAARPHMGIVTRSSPRQMPINPVSGESAQRLRGVSATSPIYPTLARIDQARGRTNSLFSIDPNAEKLERRARDLADEYWPETIWLTGLVSPAHLHAVTSRLDRERLRDDQGIPVPEAGARSAPQA